MPNINTIRQEVAKLNAYYPSSKSAEELEVISRMLTEDLEYMTDENFLECGRISRRRGKWFPTAADLLEINDEILRNRTASVKRLEGGERYQPTQEEIDELKKRLKVKTLGVL